MSARLSIVVPAYNEAARLPLHLPRLLEIVDWTDNELIVVDDGSTDGTYHVARDLVAHLPRATVLRLPVNRGKGGAVRAGVARARGGLTVFMDADMAADPALLPVLVERLRTADVVVGSRAAAGAVVHDAHHREVMGRTFNRLLRVATGLRVDDTQCGFKGFRSGVAKLLFSMSQLSGFAFDVEILALSRLMGLTVAEVPVRWDAVEGSHVRPLQDSAQMAADVLRLRRTWWARSVSAVSIAVPGTRGRPAVVNPAGADAVRQLLRRGDLVMSRGRATVGLLPFANGYGAHVTARRLRRMLPGLEITTHLLTLADLATMLRPAQAPEGIERLRLALPPVDADALVGSSRAASA